MNERSGFFYSVFVFEAFKPFAKSQVGQLISQRVHQDSKIKRTHAKKKGYLFLHACLQTFSEP